AYEAGTTQNARSLGTKKKARQIADDTYYDRRRRADSFDASPGVLPPSTRRDSTIPKSTSSNLLFFGTDDIATLKKTDGIVKAPAEDIEAEPQKEEDLGEQSEEWNELRNLARDVFSVYFSVGNDSNTDMSKTKQIKTKGIQKYIIGTMPYLTAYLTKLQLPKPIVKILLFTEASFRGMAQVYFQNSPISGLFILAAMFVQSTRVATHGVIAIIAGNLTGSLMGFDRSFLSSGLFGYNSFLVGLALATFYSPEKHEGYYWPVAAAAIIFAYFSSVLFVMLGKILSPYKTPPFTLPFNISTFMFLLAMGGMNNVNMAPVRPPELPSYESEPVTDLTARAFFAGSIRGVGQVYLANNMVSGILVLVGLLVCSRISALAAFTGSAVGAGVAALVGCSREAIENGMYGFNSSLTMVAMLMFYVPSIGSIMVGIMASIITVFIQLALATLLEPCGLPFMTLPFCFAALAFIVIQGTTSNVISVPLSSMTTPEDHLHRVTRLSQGFELLYGAIRSSSYKGNKRSLLRGFRSGTSRMNSALSEYDDAVHGESSKGFFSRISGWRNSTKDQHEDKRAGKMQRMMSFQLSTVTQKSSKDSLKKRSYTRMFNWINTGNDFEISKAQFKHFLQSIGFVNESGLDFACQTFQLMDLDRSGDIDVDEFIAFVHISTLMPEIRRLIIKFFDFVDVNNDHAVEISELDSARSYLGLPPLSEHDHSSLEALFNEEGELEYDVTIFKIKSIVKDYQRKRKAGLSLDASIHSSVRIRSSQ
ncbi:hypothetical protein ACHAXR_005514, partial [Thalassiosira sp. AJA248-18]